MSEIVLCRYCCGIIEGIPELQDEITRLREELVHLRMERASPTGWTPRAEQSEKELAEVKEKRERDLRGHLVTLKRAEQAEKELEFYKQMGPIVEGANIYAWISRVKNVESDLSKCRAERDGLLETVNNYHENIQNASVRVSKYQAEVSRFKAELEKVTAEKDSMFNHWKETLDLGVLKMGELQDKLTATQETIRRQDEQLKQDIGKIICAMDDGNLSLAKHLLLSAISAPQNQEPKEIKHD